MTSFDQADSYLGRIGGLPDPVADRRFYEGVPARRLFAFFVDLAIVWAIAIAVSLLTLGLGFFIIGLIAAVAGFAYRVLTIASSSATFGMRAMGIELRDGRGERFDLMLALGHTILFYVSFTIFVLHLVSMILMAGSSMGRALHDLPFGSAMIKSPV